mmetsp:Transcript_26062/g.60739  ORF Transcript_26062/g.60739 Transcript_26062/m.60739 type:complete len:214 (+) Transcript_26062:811-1452(+)
MEVIPFVVLHGDTHQPIRILRPDRHWLAIPAQVALALPHAIDHKSVVLEEGTSEREPVEGVVPRPAVACLNEDALALHSPVVSLPQEVGHDAIADSPGTAPCWAGLVLLLPEVLANGRHDVKGGDVRVAPDEASDVFVRHRRCCGARGGGRGLNCRLGRGRRGGSGCGWGRWLGSGGKRRLGRGCRCRCGCGRRRRLGSRRGRGLGSGCRRGR